MKEFHGVIRKSMLYLLIFAAWQISSYSDIGNRIVYMDVGQGDAILIQVGSEDILIDGGPYANLNHTLDYYKKLDTEIEYLIVTHAHDDHYLGLIELSNRYRVDNLVINPICQSLDQFTWLVEALKPKNIIYSRYITLEFFSSEKNLSMTNLDQPKMYKNEKCAEYKGNINNSSVITELKWKNRLFLFMGDSELDREEDLIAKGILPKAVSFLKAGHHCSKTSNSERFLGEVSPRNVVCSYGKNNKYGHPSKELLQRMKGRNIRVLETEKTGDIIINLSP